MVDIKNKLSVNHEKIPVLPIFAMATINYGVLGKTQYGLYPQKPKWMLLVHLSN